MGDRQRGRKSVGYFEAGKGGSGVVGKGGQTGVYVEATVDLPYIHGVVGNSPSSTGVGVWGEATHQCGQTYGLYGTTASSRGAGVSGISEVSGKYAALGGNDFGAMTNGDLVVNSGALRGDIGPGGGAPFPRPAWNSGWVQVPKGEGANPAFSLRHNLGGDAERYLVQVDSKWGSSITHVPPIWNDFNWYYDNLDVIVQNFRPYEQGVTIRVRI